MYLLTMEFCSDTMLLSNLDTVMKILMQAILNGLACCRFNPALHYYKINISPLNQPYCNICMSIN